MRMLGPFALGAVFLGNLVLAHSNPLGINAPTTILIENLYYRSAPTGPGRTAFEPTSSRLFVPSNPAPPNSPGVLVLDGPTGQQLAMIDPGFTGSSSVDDIAIDSAGGRLFVAVVDHHSDPVAPDSDRVLVYSTATFALLETIEFPGHCCHRLAFNPETDRLYGVSTPSRDGHLAPLWSVDMSKPATDATRFQVLPIAARLSDEGWEPVIDPSMGLMYFYDLGDGPKGRVLVIDVDPSKSSFHSLLMSVSLPGVSFWEFRRPMAIDEPGHRLYVEYRQRDLCGRR